MTLPLKEPTISGPLDQKGPLNLGVLYAEATQQAQAMDPRYFAPGLVLVLLDALRTTREALHGLQGQVVQARDGFGVYMDSKSMSAALDCAAAVLASVVDAPGALRGRGAA